MQNNIKTKLQTWLVCSRTVQNILYTSPSFGWSPIFSFCSVVIALSMHRVIFEDVSTIHWSYPSVVLLSGNIAHEPRTGNGSQVLLNLSEEGAHCFKVFMVWNAPHNWLENPPKSSITSRVVRRKLRRKSVPLGPKFLQRTFLKGALNYHFEIILGQVASLKNFPLHFVGKDGISIRVTFPLG